MSKPEIFPAGPNPPEDTKSPGRSLGFHLVTFPTRLPPGCDSLRIEKKAMLALPSNQADNGSNRLTLNIAIVGGGKTCKFLLEFLQNNPLPFLDLNLCGVCDIDPEAEGLLLARKMGIYTTCDYRELLDIEKLDSIIELTGDRQVLLDLIKRRPKRLAVLEHNIGRLLRTFFTLDERLRWAQQEIFLEKMSSRFLIQQSNSPILVLNPDFTIVEANDAYLQRVECSRQQAIGSPCYLVSRGFSAPCSTANPALKCPMEETLRTGKATHVIQDLSLHGLAEFCNIITYPLMNRNNEIVRIIEIMTDVTDEISTRWQERIEELKSDFKKLVQEDRLISLGKLVASCVHEINNPIQGLLTFSHLMQNTLAAGPPSAEDLENFKEFLAIMTSELERCGQIVSGLLSFSREVPLAYRAVDLNAVLNAVLSLTRHKMQLQNIKLRTRIENTPVWIHGDTNRLQQCFLNLIFNAMEAMAQGGDLNIVSRHDTRRHEVTIEIEDSGEGIGEEDLDHIFDPFFTTKAEGEGTGLGLSIVYGVIKNHGGKINVRSTKGKGTVFSIVFNTISSPATQENKPCGTE